MSTPPGPPPHPPGAPARPSGRRRLVIAIVIAVLVIVGVVTAIVLATGGEETTALQPGRAASPSLSAPALPGDSPPARPGGSQPQRPGTGSPGSGRPLPPPTPTGQAYNDDDPTIGSCVDLARRPNGVVIYQADCGDSAANLILDNIQTKDCPTTGFYGLDSLSDKVLCFTYNLAPGDCLDINIPRRTACDGAASGPKPIAKVVAVRPGQQDGAGCANPQTFVQVGKDQSRGVACLAPASGQTATTAVSR